MSLVEYVGFILSQICWVYLKSNMLGLSKVKYVGFNLSRICWVYLKSNMLGLS